MNNTDILFGIFHTEYSKTKNNFENIISSKLINTIILESNYESEEFRISMEELKRHPEIKVWISVGYLAFSLINNLTVADTCEQSAFNPTATFLSDYKERINGLVNFLKENDFYDNIVGFYMDEPLLWNIKNEWLEEFTKYCTTVAAKGKRFFVCFSVAGVAPEIWTINDVKPIYHDSVKYITDIAFDMYHKWSDDYNVILNHMLRRIGNRKDMRIWMIPCTMNYRGTYKEEYAIEHLNNCYKLLKSFDNPGGLMCYTYYTFPSDVEDLGNLGLDRIGNQNNKNYWPNLVKRMKEISKEIIG